MGEAASQPAAIILAAGKGTRMRDDLPKVAHHVGGRPMVCAVVDACIQAGCAGIVVVVGYKHDIVRRALAAYPTVTFAMQNEQLGTGHAVLCAEPQLKGPDAPRDCFVLCGDGPLIRARTLTALLARHRQTSAAATLATAVIDDPTGYGRIVRGTDGVFQRIVEHKNTSPAERAIREVNPSYYCFDRAALFDSLRAVKTDATSGEVFLTDALAVLLARRLRVEVEPGVPPEDILSINTPEDLAVVDAIYRRRSAHSADAAPRTLNAGLTS
ncbi:MAG: NTP transferase domain-containing protein [Phycisphaerales bacterium]